MKANTKLRQIRILNTSLDHLCIFFGTVLYAFAIHVFTAPNQIAPGGVTGLSIALNFMFPFISIGNLVLLFNVPLIILGYKFLGKSFLIKTILSPLYFSLTYDYIFTPFLPYYNGNPILAALFGGVLTGIGMAIVFMRGGSTGGTDISNKIIQQNKPHISLGKIIFASDVVVIVFAAFVFWKLETAMYAIVAMFVAARVMDWLMYGLDTGKMVMIITDNIDTVSQKINDKLERGCTILKGTGSYTKSERNVIMCAIKNSQFYRLKRIIYSSDPTAFMMVSNVSEVWGEGFKSIGSE